jgi:DNA (cytosine-5)-methyltransferase 3A
LAGSPCQGFSFAGKQLAFDDPRSALFFEFIRLLKAIKPKYFLLENVKMKKEFLEVITDQVSACYPEFQGHDLFGGRIEPILINSSLVSAQSRQRYYWTNIPNIQQPEDRGIILRDILETDAISDEFIHGQKSVDYMNRGNEKWQQAGNRRADRYEQSADKEKSFAITANWHKGVPYNYFKETRLTKPKQVGMASEISGHDILKRVYSPDGKSPTLNAHGGGNTEPKVMVDKSHPIKANYYKSSRANFENDQSKGGKFSATGVPVRSKIRKKSKTVRSGGRDSYDRHEWDSVDELHWRKLTPLECERLQTVPDNYTNHVSNTQRYKMLGNGWTVDVIAHIFTFMQRAHNGEHLVTKGQINLDL